MSQEAGLTLSSHFLKNDVGSLDSLPPPTLPSLMLTLIPGEL